MRIHTGDSVIIGGDTSAVGIVERRNGQLLTVRFPDYGNRRETVFRIETQALAELMYEARKKGTKFSNDLKLAGGSTLSDLVNHFGYSTGALRQDSLYRVKRQLERAGLDIKCASDRWGRDDEFKLVISQSNPPSTERADDPVPAADVIDFELPDPFWPTALGLSAQREILFLRSLSAAEPLLCLLYIPENGSAHPWLQSTWEGLLSWAYLSAQKFCNRETGHLWPEILVGPSGMLQAFLKSSVLHGECPQLKDEPHCLNLVCVENAIESPVEINRLRARWPGRIYEFAPSLPATDTEPSTDIASLIQCLLLVAGETAKPNEVLSPLNTLIWSKEASCQLLARGTSLLGEIFVSEALKSFRGSNESDTALAIKAMLAHWTKRITPQAKITFEQREVEEADDDFDFDCVTRVDLVVSGKERFEVETLAGSGPMENFYHRKVFSRVKTDGLPLAIVVPNATMLWAGPFLADIAHHLAANGRVLVPGVNVSFMNLMGRPLPFEEVRSPPWTDLAIRADDNAGTVPDLHLRLKLKDIAGYDEVKKQIQNQILWHERHWKVTQRPSRSSGILFFGPPGCGKSRLAQAIAGELDQEVRLLAPSDLRGAYIGWGQIMIREQFDWLAEKDTRMLIIDELDAIARSRRKHADMHSDEQASVNELLVQLDRICRLGRLIVGTTNYVDSLDDAVLRSGRFGRFVPVAPPTVDEALRILEYYLRFIRLKRPQG